MRTYIIKKLAERPELLSGKAFSPDALPKGFDTLNEGRVDIYPWGGDYRPEVRFWIGWHEEGLYVLTAAKEDTIQAKETKISGRQCVDSCMEFFFMPCPDTDPDYFNFELNPLAIPHIGLGIGRRPPRKHFTELPEGSAFTASAHENGWWAVCYFIPAAFIAGEIEGFKPESGKAINANVYKCDESVHPHFGVWNDVSAAQPDFHRPECFGKMIFE